MTTADRRLPRVAAVAAAAVAAMAIGFGGTPASAAGKLELRAEGEQRTIDCAGLDVVIEGNRDKYTLRGGCASVTVRGEGDLLRAELASGAHVLVEGNEVQLVWNVAAGGADPLVTLNGRGNHASRDGVTTIGAPSQPPPQATPASANPPIPAVVVPSVPMPTGAPPPPPPAPAQPRTPIEISLSFEARDLDCTGREVHITANNGLFALRGGCTAVVVHGNDDLVQAELAPGARIDLVGKNIKLAYVQTSADPSPTVHADGDKTRAFPISAWGALTGPVQ